MDKCLVQSLLRQITLNTSIHQHLPLYDFANIGLFYNSHWYKMFLFSKRQEVA